MTARFADRHRPERTGAERSAELVQPNFGLVNPGTTCNSCRHIEEVEIWLAVCRGEEHETRRRGHLRSTIGGFIAILECCIRKILHAGAKARIF